MTGELTVEVRDFSELTPEDRAQWSAWQAADPLLDSPYFHVEFAEITARVGVGCKLAVFHRGGVSAGYFPYQVRGGAVLPIAAPMNDYQGVIGPKALRPSLRETADLLGAAKFSVNAWVDLAPDALITESCWATLPAEGGYEAWYEERRAKFGKYFKDKERARRSLQNEVGEIESRIGVRDPILLDDLIALKREQYRRTNRHDIFACGWTRDLLHALMKTDHPEFGASMAVLTAGGQVAAMEYSLHSKERYHFWFPAYVPSLGRCSPGILLGLETIRMGAERGYRYFDYGFGGEAYKNYFADTALPVAEETIFRHGLPQAMGRATASLMSLAGEERGRRLHQSVRRRWNVIEACEPTTTGRLRGVVQAASAALGKATGQAKTAS